MLAQRLGYEFGGNNCPSFKGYITKCFIEKGCERNPSYIKCKKCIVEGINFHIRNKS